MTSLSLFHVVLPLAMLWMLARLGHDSRVFVMQIIIAWIVLPLTYAVLRPQDEIVNWVREFGKPQQWVKPRTPRPHRARRRGPSCAPRQSGRLRKKRSEETWRAAGTHFLRTLRL